MRGKWHPLEGHFPYEITMSDELTHEDRLGSYPRRGAIFGKKAGDLRVFFSNYEQPRDEWYFFDDG